MEQLPRLAERIESIRELRELMRAMRTIRTVLSDMTVCIVADAGLDDQKLFRVERTNNVPVHVVHTSCSSSSSSVDE